MLEVIPMDSGMKQTYQLIFSPILFPICSPSNSYPLAGSPLWHDRYQLGRVEGYHVLPIRKGYLPPSKNLTVIVALIDKWLWYRHKKGQTDDV